jgi:hypothetical protein
LAHLAAVRADDLIRAIERYAARHGVMYRAESGKGSHRKIWLERNALSRTRSSHIFPINFIGLAGVK